MHFKAEELATKVFPGSRRGLWACHQDTLAGGYPCTDGTDITCPQDTMRGPGDGDHPCPDNTDQPCPQDTMREPGDGDDPCPQDTMPPTPHPPRPPHKAAGTLSLLQAQLRERLDRGSVDTGSPGL